IDHQLLLKALRKHCQEPWVLLYVERWLKAPMRLNLPGGIGVQPRPLETELSALARTPQSAAQSIPPVRPLAADALQFGVASGA
ncbi:hypothetical protein, partial [Chromobacterium alticapitis]|uniref:hypothetical protein n=1 Tax=Chromobacterium alticapitis TaxID=2073169 RepID=UPI001E364772